MKFSHTHDIAKYSAWAVLIDIISSKIAGSGHLGFWKISITSPRVDGCGSNFERWYRI